MSRVVHFEIHASDPQRVIDFYSGLFGWSFAPWGPPGAYWFIRTAPDAEAGHQPPGIDGGLVPRRGAVSVDGQPVNSFVCTVDVTDVTATMDMAVQRGATVAVPRMAIHGIGWLGYLKDPDGNIFGVMQNDPTAA